LLRKYRSLEAINQTAPEAHNLRMGRVFPQLAKGACGTYSMAVRADPEARLAELERRRRCAKSQCRAAYEHCAEEFWDAPHYLHPAGKVNEKAGYGKYTITDQHKIINEAIVAGNVKDWRTEYVPYELLFQVRARVLYRMRIGAASALEYAAWEAEPAPDATLDETLETLGTPRALPVFVCDGDSPSRVAPPLVLGCHSSDAHRLRSLAREVRKENAAYYSVWPLHPSDAVLQRKKLTSEAYTINSQAARKRAFADAKGRRAFDRYTAAACERVDRLSAPTPAASFSYSADTWGEGSFVGVREHSIETEESAACQLPFYRHVLPITLQTKGGKGRARHCFHRPQKTGENPAPQDPALLLTGSLLTEVHTFPLDGDSVRALFMLEANTLHQFQQNGVFNSLLLQAVEDAENITFVDLIVRSNAKQQAPARSAYAKAGFKKITKKKLRIPACSPSAGEWYMRVAVEDLHEYASRRPPSPPVPPVPLFPSPPVQPLAQVSECKA
jgi:hypothetical protein